MDARTGLVWAAVAVVASAGPAAAQIVTITGTGVVAGAPPKADPRGRWSVPAAGTWQVEIDYGTVAGGAFKPDRMIGAGGTVTLNTQGGADGTWGPHCPEALRNPLPADAHVRVRLRKQNADGTWDYLATAYRPLK